MILPMVAAHAAQIARWSYANEYAAYSFSPGDDTMAELLNGEYYAYLDSDNTLAGYFCFGRSAQIPTVEKNPYAPGALDMGLGMRPDLCGQGLGAAFLHDGLKFAQCEFDPEQIHLSVAVSNLRAVRTYEKAGFRYAASVTHRKSRKLFYLMVRPCGQRSVQ